MSKLKEEVYMDEAGDLIVWIAHYPCYLRRGERIKECTHEDAVLLVLSNNLKGLEERRKKI